MEIVAIKVEARMYRENVRIDKSSGRHVKSESPKDILFIARDKL